MRNIYLRSVIMTDMHGNSDTMVSTETVNNFSAINSDYDERQQVDADNVAILDGRMQYGKEHRLEPISVIRCSCLVASLLLCFGTVIVFLWFIPCNKEGACPAFIDRPRTTNWLNNYTKIELKGPIHVVDGWRWLSNLVFLYRGDRLFSVHAKTSNIKRNGVISLDSHTGSVSWFDEMTDEPIAMDCTLIDVDNNGQSDCLLMDECGELGVINPKTGLWYWHYNERSTSKVDVYDFPLILPDLDNDSVMELLIVTSTPLEQRTKHYVQQGDVPKSKDSHNLEQRNYLTILSGRTGQPIGERFKFHECDSIKNLHVDTPKVIGFNCLHNNTAPLRSKTLPELFALITNQSSMKIKLKSLLNISQYHYSDQNNPSRNVYSLSGRELLVENRGTCPDCNVTVILSQSFNGKSRILQNFTEKGMYGMKPVQWNFANNKATSGFVMKFWKWSNDEYLNKIRKISEKEGKNLSNGTLQKMIISKSKTNSHKSKSSKAINFDSKFLYYNLNKEFVENNFSYDYGNNNTPEKYVPQLTSMMFQRDVLNHNRNNNNNNNYNKKGTLNVKPSERSILNDDYKMQLINESIVLIIFSGSETRIENILQNKVVQLCWNYDLYNGTEIMCQPDVNYQSSSMIVADLDQDGDQELITYTPTFVQQYMNNTYEWRLITYVRLIRLELELLKYKDKKMYTKKIQTF